MNATNDIIVVKKMNCQLLGQLNMILNTYNMETKNNDKYLDNIDPSKIVIYDKYLLGKVCVINSPRKVANAVQSMMVIHYY